MGVWSDILKNCIFFSGHRILINGPNNVFSSMTVIESECSYSRSGFLSMPLTRIFPRKMFYNQKCYLIRMLNAYIHDQVSCHATDLDLSEQKMF